MKKNIISIITSVFLLFFVGGMVIHTPEVIDQNVQANLGAPTSRLERTMLPEADSTYELGTSTRAWLTVTTDELCLTADTCETSWPAGGGSSVASTSVATLSQESTTTASSLYTLTSGIDVEFKTSGATSTLYFDESTGYLGVATTVPSNALTVEGVIDGATELKMNGMDVFQMYGNHQATGLLSGGLLTATVGTTTEYDISDGSGVVVDPFSDPENPTFVEVEWTGLTGNTPSFAANLGTYVAIDSTGAIVEAEENFSNEQRRSLIVLGLVNTFDGSTVGTTGDVSHTMSASYLTNDMATAIGFINISGNNYNAASTNLTVRKEAGQLFSENINRATNAKDPNTATSAVDDPLTWIYFYNDGTGDITLVTGVTDVDPDQYDDGSGTLASVPNNKFTNQLFYFFPDTGVTLVQYGETIYANLAEAEADIASLSFTQFDPSLGPTNVRTVLSVGQGTTDVSDTSDAVFAATGKFGLSGGGGTAGGTFQDLQDVYNNSVTPEIVTDTTRGALTIKRGTAADTDDVLEILNGSDAMVFAVTGEGETKSQFFNATSTTATSTFAGGLTVDTSDLVVDPDGGRVGIGTTSPGSLLSLNGISNFTTATSTFYSTGGINLGSGCFAIAGTCLGGGTGDVTKVGTPVDNEIGVWTGDGTLEGDTNFVWDGSELLITGGGLLTHTATEDDEHAVELDVDAAGFGDVKALDISYITGAIGAGEDEGVLLVNIDESTAAGGEVFGLEVLTTDFGATSVFGLKLGVDVNPISHDSGTFGNMDSALNNAVDVLAALSSGGAGNISMFVADNDTLTIGDAGTFDEMEILVDTGSSGSGIGPVFEYSTGVDTWATFVPTDGTSGFRNTGAILWDSADLAGWAVGTGSEFLVRVTRTRNSLATTPIVDTIQITSATIYSWDKDGVITGNTLEATGDTAAGDNAVMGYTATEGLILTGQGSTYDVTIKNDADSNVMQIPTGGTIVQMPSLTASEILITDANKGLVSAAVATYPSLTELTYVKGVTSAIQTQLDAKGVGDVTKVGTPVNNELGVWTGDGTLEGDTDITWDGSRLDIRAINSGGSGIKLFSSFSDSTTQSGRLKGGHYLNAEEPVSGLILQNGASSNAVYVGGSSSSENAATFIALYTAANNTTLTGTQRMTIGSGGDINFNSGDVFFDNSTGNVGIGTSTPLYPLHIKADASDQVIYFEENSGTEFMSLLMASTGDLSFVADNGSYKLKIYDTTSGVSTPALLGMTTGGTLDSNTYLNMQNTDTIQMVAGGIEFIELSEGSNDYLLFDEAATGVLVGIATATPATTLDVNGLARGGVNHMTDASTIDIDWSLGNSHDVVFGGNRTITFSNVAVGAAIRVFFTQDATGSRVPAFPTAVTWGSAGAPTFDTTGGNTDIVTFTVATSSETVHARFAD